MNKFVVLGALVISLALIVYLYVRLSATERALTQAQQHVRDCEQVTFQLQNQLSEQQKLNTTRMTKPNQ